MFNLYENGDGYIILDTTNPATVVILDDLPHLLGLRMKINQVIDTLETDGPAADHYDARKLTSISTTEAVKHAQERGHDLPHNSILSACVRGNVIGAQKIRGRWSMPVWAFDDWLAGWVERKGEKT